MPVRNFCNILRRVCNRNRARKPTRAMRDYRDCFTVLGVSPDTNWDALRAQYRRLISQWHPDRFSADPGQRRLAEEQSKQITVAYQALEQYRREHGTLPYLTPAPVLDDVRARTRDASAPPSGGDSNYRPEAGMAYTVEHGRAKRMRARRSRVLFVALCLLPVLYFAHEYLGELFPVDRLPASSVHKEDIPQAPPVHAEGSGPQLIISIGSTLGDVIAVQGIPTRTQGETWHYGKSEIRFAHGKVVSWAEDPDFPLRIARNQPVQMREGTFRAGSTKSEVRATQGTPVTESATVWDYGLSRVYFEDNRVVRWEESPMQPLRVSR